MVLSISKLTHECDQQPPFSVGDQVQFRLSVTHTPTFEVYKFEERKGQKCYQLKKPDGEIWTDEKGNPWVEQRRLFDPTE